MSLVHNPVLRKSPTVLVPLESFLFLQDKQCFERSGKHSSEKNIERHKRNFEEFSYDGYKQIMNGDLGGCKGSPENAWEERRWTSWSVEDVKRILDEASLPWKDGEEVEYIAL